MSKPSQRSPERKLTVVLSMLRGEVSVAIDTASERVDFASQQRSASRDRSQQTVAPRMGERLTDPTCSAVSWEIEDVVCEFAGTKGGNGDLPVASHW